MLTNYVELTFDELAKLDRKSTVFMMSVSPIEVHGHHLPVGTDVFIAEKILEQYAKDLSKKHPELTIIKLPPLYLGSDALPLPGSLSVEAKYLQGVLLNYGKGLSQQGFRYLFLADNHGGPRHQMAIEKASRRLWRSYHFYLVDPFNSDFYKMVQHDPDFLKKAGLKPQVCGDDPDSHAGTNETSLMLTLEPDCVKEDYQKEAASMPPKITGFARATQKTAVLLDKIGFKEAGNDLLHLANTLAWINSANMKPYMGDPKKASKEAGQGMLKARLDNAIELFEQALQGKTIKVRPLLWSLRFLSHLPE